MDYPLIQLKLQPNLILLIISWIPEKSSSTYRFRLKTFPMFLDKQSPWNILFLNNKFGNHIQTSTYNNSYQKSSYFFIFPEWRVLQYKNSFWTALDQMLTTI